MWLECSTVIQKGLIKNMSYRSKLRAAEDVTQHWSKFTEDLYFRRY